MTPLFELGVAEAYELLNRLDPTPEVPLPPLDAIENEDWGRDLLLSRLQALGESALRSFGVTLHDQASPPGATSAS